MTLFGDTPEDVRRSMRLLVVVAIVWPLMLAVSVLDAVVLRRCR